LRTAAERLDCEVFLAQADVHETWQCDSDPEEWYPSRGRSWRDSWDDFDGDDDPGDDGRDDVEPIMTDLIDSDIDRSRRGGTHRRGSRETGPSPRTSAVAATDAGSPIRS
jgi:hypothetical protein